MIHIGFAIGAGCALGFGHPNLAIFLLTLACLWKWVYLDDPGMPGRDS